ncbi:unnamed protein product, partial [marine sediment metagenome]
ADVCIDAAHLTYKAARGQQMIQACIDQLEKRRKEIVPKKASPAYKKARYGGKE